MQFIYKTNEIKSSVERFCYGKKKIIIDYLLEDELNFMCTYCIF
jgi:hypothetical protein